MVLLAARPEGVRNGVYGLLEDYLGCHWFTPGEIGESIPSRTTVEVELPAQLTGVKPNYELRRPWYNANALPHDGGQNPKWRPSLSGACATAPAGRMALQLRIGSASFPNSCRSRSPASRR